MKKLLDNWKIILGFVISIIFMILAFKDVNFSQMLIAFKGANYWYILPSLLVIFLSHYLRSVRWKYLLEPIAHVPVTTLFSSLLIGYMANTFLPAHLGEFLRAFMVQKKKSVSGSAVFGTVVIERIIDVFTMILLLAILMIVFPFPDWVQKSGYLSFIFILILFIMLVLLKKYRETSLRVLTKILFAFPQHVKDKVYGMVHTFLEGIVPLKSRWHYIMVAVLSIIIWICYAYVFQLVFYAFNFVDLYSLPWSTAFVLLVITTIAILVPSSPGYVGTYHWMCMIGLGLFNIPESEALSFAFVMHGLNFIPILIVGLVIISIEGISIKAAQKNAQMDIG